MLGEWEVNHKALALCVQCLSALIPMIYSRMLIDQQPLPDPGSAAAFWFCSFTFWPSFTLSSALVPPSPTPNQHLTFLNWCGWKASCQQHWNTLLGALSEPLLWLVLLYLSRCQQNLGSIAIWPVSSVLVIYYQIWLFFSNVSHNISHFNHIMITELLVSYMWGIENNVQWYFVKTNAL